MKSQMTRVFVLSIVLAVLPFLFVEFPPSTDLPQHLAQVQLAKYLMHGGESDLYQLNLFAPNNFVYLLVAAVDVLAPLNWAGKTVMLLLVLSWIVSSFYLAIDRGRPAIHALLTSVFAFNFCFYWGFLNFLIGWPFFILFIVVSNRRVTVRSSLCKALLGLILLLCHSLWFMLACIYLVALSFGQRQSPFKMIYACVPMLPAGIFSLTWMVFLSGSRASAGFDTAAYWGSIPARFSIQGLTDSALGGIRSGFEVLILFAVFVWIGLAVFTNKKHLRAKVDFPLLLGAVIMFLLYAIAPDKYLNTLFFAQRWLPCSMILLLLSLPMPALKTRILPSLAVIFCIAFSVLTVNAWFFFDKDELSGLKESLAVLPEAQKTLGLNFMKESRYVKGYPFLQIFAYAQAYKGGDLNFSFAQHMSGIVIAQPDMPHPWTRSLEWYPERITDNDYQFFDYVIINAPSGGHKYFSSHGLLSPCTYTGTWRLYKTVDDKD